MMESGTGSDVLLDSFLDVCAVSFSTKGFGNAKTLQCFGRHHS
jgi:hypothetical protein